MGHPVIQNRTPLVFEMLFLLDEQARPVLTMLVKGTFAIRRDGRCVLADEQLAVSFAGEYWGEDPATSSYKYEPEVAFMKPATDVVLIGHACAPHAGVTEVLVSLRVGPVEQRVKVFGDRTWSRGIFRTSATRPAAFEKIPLRWERAFGGTDRSHRDPSYHACEPRNPVGIGFYGSHSDCDGAALPNLEEPRSPLHSISDRPPPAGFGFISPHWQPRAALAGTYDERWRRDRAPLLAKNFDRRHMNAAAPSLIAPGYLRGDEPVLVTGVSAQGPLSFCLPGIPPPRAQVAVRECPREERSLKLDTVIIDSDEQRLLLLWRAYVELPTGPHDVHSIDISGGFPVS